MFMVKILANHLLNICSLLVKKSQCESLEFQMLNLNLSKLILKIRFSCIKKVSIYFISTLLILCGIILNFNFDITMSCFRNARINFMCDKDHVIVSKVHYESIFFLKFIV